ncbi:MAG: DUF1232 domain-containing protein [Candidatus Riflebacteria bacterium]|nr:DUF1232 domain-containing protein [Candidatus Riflebacteria bacterium]
MAKSQIQLKTEELVVKYTNRFLRYLKFAHLPVERREILLGTFGYLLDEDDLVPDNLPNVGLLDDLMIFIKVTETFISESQFIPGVCTYDEFVQDKEFFDKNKGLLYGISSPSVDVIRKKGKAMGEVEIKVLSDKVKEKFSKFGRIEE